MEWRRWDLEQASPSFRSARYPKLQIFVEMRFRTNLQPAQYAAAMSWSYVASWNSTAQTHISSFTCTTFSLQMVKNPEESISVFRPLCQATPQAWSSKCAGFQMKAAIQFSQKLSTYIHFVPLMPYEENNLSHVSVTVPASLLAVTIVNNYAVT